jgi:PAS domain S-box-containing protein
MDVKSSFGATVLRRAVLIFGPLTMIAASVVYLLYRSQTSAYWSIFRAEEKQIIELAYQRTTSDLGPIVSDIGYLARQASLQQWLNLARPVDRSRLSEDYLAFASHKAVYDQILFLDLDGREVVRVDWNDGRPRIVPDTALLNAANGDYRYEAMRLQAGQIHASPFVLNGAHGTAAQPPRPTLRLSAPVFDAEGRKRGIVMVSYLGQNLLDRIGALREYTRGELWLVNAQGYWLLGPRNQDPRTFMAEGRAGHTFEKAYPGAWAQIRGNPGPDRFQTPAGFFSFIRININDLRGESPVIRAQAARVTAAEAWVLVAHVPSATVNADIAATQHTYAVASGSLALLLAFVAWFTAQHWTARDAGERAVRLSEARFRGLVDAAPDAVVITDHEGTITFVSNQVQVLFGYERKELLGQKIEILVPSSYRSAHTAHRRDYVAAPRARRMGRGPDLHGMRKDGSTFPIAVSLSPVETEQGLAVFADIRDVTERHLQQRQLEELNARLERDNAELAALNGELEAFSYSVSHDLRTPLRAVDGFSQALLEDNGERLDDTGRSHLQRVRQAAQRMGMLIDDLLKLARVTRTEMIFDDVDLTDLARSVVEDLRQADPSRQAEIAIAPDLIAKGDGRLLRVVLENLLGNAWKFTAGRSPARIAFASDEIDGATTYFVRDNGVGFDMAYASKLFGAFQRLHDAREFAGTGVGLATVQRIVHKHGGRIWADSAPGDGAIFRFTL